MVLATPATRECTQSVVDCNYIYHRARDNAIYDFSKKAVENGLDIFRVFDSLNYFGAFDRIR
jgi:pyruvate carboxylase